MWLRQGHFPDPGTWRDQSSRFIDMVNIFDAGFKHGENKLEELKENAKTAKRQADRARQGLR